MGMWLNHYKYLKVLIAFIFFQNKTLSLNPAKKAVLVMRRLFGSETAESVGVQPMPVTAKPVHENDVLTKLDEPSAVNVASSQDEV